MELLSSHGYETPSSKLLMRATVLASDILCEQQLTGAMYALLLALLMQLEAGRVSPVTIPSPRPFRLLRSLLPCGAGLLGGVWLRPARARPAGGAGGAAAQPGAHADRPRPLSVQLHQPGAGGKPRCHPGASLRVAALPCQWRHACLMGLSAYWRALPLPAALQVGAAAAIGAGHGVLGSVLFSLSLNHKQMSLYYAPAFFGHLLGRCLQRRAALGKARGSSLQLLHPTWSACVQGVPGGTLVLRAVPEAHHLVLRTETASLP